EVELPAPAGQRLAPAGQVLFQLVKEGRRMADAGAGHAGDAPGQPALGLQHGGGGAAAAVAVAEALQHVPGQVLVLEALPAAHDLFGVQQAVVGGVEVGAGVQVGVGVVVFGGDEVGQHLGAVDAPPAGQVVG